MEWIQTITQASYSPLTSQSNLLDFTVLWNFIWSVDISTKCWMVFTLFKAFIHLILRWLKKHWIEIKWFILKNICKVGSGQSIVLSLARTFYQRALTSLLLFPSSLPMRQLQTGTRPTYLSRCPSEWRMRMTTTPFSRSKFINLKFQKVVDSVRWYFLGELFCECFRWPFVLFLYEMYVPLFFSFLWCLYVS